MHQIRPRQTYTTCGGGPTSVYPERVVVIAHDPGGRTVRVRGDGGVRSGHEFDIPASYFHETSTTKAGRKRITGYYLVRSG
ncbi:hypothetical protein ACSCBZ_46825 [Streptomyces niveiscabiei]|uniref:hypothetical protein n=1 Tax=Streptomyces niveiscabiei TaxID=164115 RepID=UPI0006EB3FFD|nr:hypothetical protein [Streptomyces niveiscabiei]